MIILHVIHKKLTLDWCPWVMVNVLPNTSSERAINMRTVSTKLDYLKIAKDIWIN